MLISPALGRNDGPRESVTIADQRSDALI